MISFEPTIFKIVTSRYASATLVFSVAFLTYFNSLYNGFVYDDESLIINNHWIKDIRYIPEILLSDSWGFKGEGASNFYRPLMGLYFMACYYLFGLEPWGWHFVYVLFHGAVSVLVLLVASMLLTGTTAGDGKTPLFAALFFAVHPIHTQVVAWNAIHEISLGFFCLLSLLFHMKGKKTASVVAFTFAALSKETAAVLPLLIICYDYAFEREKFFRAWGGMAWPERLNLLLKRYLPFLIVGASYLLLRGYAIGGFAPTKRHADLSLYEYVINVFPLFAKYLEKLLIPLDLNPAHVFHPIDSLLHVGAVLSVVVTAAFIAALFASRNKRPVVFFCLALIVLPLLPVLYIPGMGVHVFAENYLYLPSAGFVILLALVLFTTARRLFSETRARLTALVSAVFIITVLYSTWTVVRNPIWKDNLSLWTDTIKKSPDSHIARNNLGIAYFKASREDEAVAEYLEALKLNPGFAEAHTNLGISYYRLGRVKEAVEEFQLAIALKPTHANAHYNLGIAYGKLGMEEEAYAEIKKAMELSSKYATKL